MTLRHYVIFKTVCDTHSMTKAAQRLYVSQPTISQAIKELENHFHVTLFIRNNQETLPTVAATNLLTQVTSLLGQFEKTENYFSSSESQCNIGINNAFDSVIPAMYKILDNHLQNPNFAFFNAPYCELEQALLSKRIDFAVTDCVNKNPECLYETICVFKLSWIAAKEFPCPDRIDTDELATLPLILREKDSGTRNVFDRIMQKKGHVVMPKMESYDNYSLLQAAIDQKGITLIADNLIPTGIMEHLKTIDVLDETFLQSLYVMHSKKSPLTHQALQVASCIKEHFPEIYPNVSL